MNFGIEGLNDLSAFTLLLSPMSEHAKPGGKPAMPMPATVILHCDQSESR